MKKSSLRFSLFGMSNTVTSRTAPPPPFPSPSPTQRKSRKTSTSTKSPPGPWSPARCLTSMKRSQNNDQCPMTKAQGKSKSQGPTPYADWDERYTSDGLLEEGATYVVKKYDLAERTARFGEAVIGLARKVRQNPVTSP